MTIRTADIYLPDKRLNETERNIIRSLGEHPSGLSAYSISKLVNMTYPGVFRYCKKLNSQKILIPSESVGEKGGTKTIYTLSFLGILYYFYLFVNPVHHAAKYPGPLSTKYHNEMEIVSKLTDEDPILKMIIALYKSVNNSDNDDYSVFLESIHIVLFAIVDIIQYGLDIADLTNEEIKCKFHTSVSNNVFDFFWREPCREEISDKEIEAYEQFLKISLISDYLQDNLYRFFKEQVYILNRIVHTFPDENKYFKNMDALRDDIEKLEEYILNS